MGVPGVIIVYHLFDVRGVIGIVIKISEYVIRLLISPCKQIPTVCCSEGKNLAYIFGISMHEYNGTKDSNLHNNSISYGGSGEWKYDIPSLYLILAHRQFARHFTQFLHGPFFIAV